MKIMIDGSIAYSCMTRCFFVSLMLHRAAS